ncbi:MAG: hypothetical protein WBB27_04465, partial [Maribacter sp.]
EGFSKVREFFSPDYTSTKPEHRREDYRTTLHWEPNVEINTDGEAKINFFTGDNLGTYQIMLEGITDDGRPFHTMERFKVEVSQ